MQTDQNHKSIIAAKIYDIITELSGHSEPDAPQIAAMFEYPPDIKMGDFSFPCFKLAKTLKKAPNMIAENIKEKFNLDIIKKVETAGGYLNFFIKDSEYAGNIIANINCMGDGYGSSKIGEGKSVVIDFSSPNIAKPFHIAHLLSTTIGNSIRNIYDFLGYKTIAINYLGDWGTQFGKVITAYKRWCNDITEVEEKGVYKLTELYVRFTLEAEADKSLIDEARGWFVKLEQHDAEAYQLWEKFREISLKEFIRTYDDIGIGFDSFDGESFFNDKMDAVVHELEEKQLLKLDAGAKIVDLSEFNMPPCLILKSDGATLYPTRDIAAVLYRKKTYNFYKSIYVTDMRQALHFAQWKKVVELMGYDFAEDCIHVTFGMMSFDGKPLGTRSGNMLLLDDIFKMAIDKVSSIIEEKNPNLSAEEKSDIAKKVGIGSIIFTNLANSRIKDIDFRWEEALSFNGNSGPYIQYTYARICKVLEKSAGSDASICENITLELVERELVQFLSQFPDKVATAARECEPSVISRYLLDLCGIFNRFYNENPILRAEDANVKRLRLALCKASRYVIGNGLSLIGLAKTETV